MTGGTNHLRTSMTIAGSLTMLFTGIAGTPSHIDGMKTQPDLPDDTHDYRGYQRLEQQVGEVKTAIIAKMIEDSIYPELIRAIIAVESSWRINSVSSRHAIGLMQIREIAAKEIDPSITEETLFDPMRNVELGIQIFEHHMNYFDEYNEKEHWALSSYNRGRVGTFALKQRPPSTRYSRKVLELTGAM